MCFVNTERDDAMVDSNLGRKDAKRASALIQDSVGYEQIGKDDAAPVDFSVYDENYMSELWSFMLSKKIAKR
jgi:hypothetical protein